MGFEPFGLAETRLEGHCVLILFQVERLGQQACSLWHSLCGYGSPRSSEFRHAVKTHQSNLSGLPFALPVAPAPLRQHALMLYSRVVVEMSDSRAALRMCGGSATRDYPTRPAPVQCCWPRVARIQLAQRQDLACPGGLGAGSITAGLHGGWPWRRGVIHHDATARSCCPRTLQPVRAAFAMQALSGEPSVVRFVEIDFRRFLRPGVVVVVGDEMVRQRKIGCHSHAGASPRWSLRNCARKYGLTLQLVGASGRTRLSSIRQHGSPGIVMAVEAVLARKQLNAVAQNKVRSVEEVTAAILAKSACAGWG